MIGLFVKKFCGCRRSVIGLMGMMGKFLGEGMCVILKVC